MDKQVIITIGREYGSGGHVIAQDIAKRFNVPYYNRNLIEEVAKQNNFDTDNIKDYDESPRKYLFSRTVQGYSNSPEEILAGLQFDFIKEKAASGESFVIVGRCADYVLKNRPNVVSIYIEAPRAFCVERTIANMGVTPEVANATIERTDKFRADYYKYYTHGNYWTNPVNYDLTLNSDRVGVENCVKTIEQYLIIKGFIKADMIKPVGELI